MVSPVGLTVGTTTRLPGVVRRPPGKGLALAGQRPELCKVFESGCRLRDRKEARLPTRAGAVALHAVREVVRAGAEKFDSSINDSFEPARARWSTSRTRYLVAQAVVVNKGTKAASGRRSRPARAEARCPDRDDELRRDQSRSSRRPSRASRHDTRPSALKTKQIDGPSSTCRPPSTSWRCRCRRGRSSASCRRFPAASTRRRAPAKGSPLSACLNQALAALKNGTLEADPGDLAVQVVGVPS